MTTSRLIRTTLSLAAATALMLTAVSDATARNLSYSAGKGVKCYYVLVSSVNGVNVWQTVCRKGV